jgi:hypothetical protein
MLGEAKPTKNCWEIGFANQHVNFLDGLILIKLYKKLVGRKLFLTAQFFRCVTKAQNSICKEAGIKENSIDKTYRINDNIKYIANINSDINRPQKVYNIHLSDKVIL